jgi:prolipoprotein diacylglyceryl transferase
MFAAIAPVPPPQTGSSLRLFASIPSPSSGSLHLGPLKLNAYGLCIALGMFVAVWLSDRRWRAAGGTAEDVGAIALWALPAGVIGARLYHVATDWKSFRGRWFDVVKVWEGGLGIWGGIALGTLAGVAVARRRRFRVSGLLDAVAPAIPLAQAIGRWGNWFNTELFGRPTTLPWALEVPIGKRPGAFAGSPTFHPTFLYESLWNVFVALLVIAVQKRFGHRLKSGRLFAVYVAGYTFGRFFIEGIRIDNSTRLGGLRLNEWTSMVVFAFAVLFIVTGLRRGSADGDGSSVTPDQRVANPAQ